MKKIIALLRLAIISFLINVDWADFNKLMKVTSATKGNLSVQLSKLKDAGYISIKKSFKGNYPHTECRITAKGRKEFNTYLNELKQLLNL